MPLLTLEMLMALILCGLAFIAYRIVRQAAGKGASGVSGGRARFAWLGQVLRGGAATARQLFRRKPVAPEPADEATAPARMRVLDTQKLASEGVWTGLAQRHDYYERVEQSLEQWFGLYERGRISAETYEGLLAGELRRVKSDRQILVQSSGVGVSKALFTLEDVDEAIAAIRWCIAWIAEQKQANAAIADQAPGSNPDDPAAALPNAA